VAGSRVPPPGYSADNQPVKGFLSTSQRLSDPKLAASRKIVAISDGAAGRRSEAKEFTAAEVTITAFDGIKWVVLNRFALEGER